MSLSGLVFRLVKGTPLTAAEGDQNLRIIRNAFNALEQLFLTVLKPDGTLKDGAVATTDVIADGIVTAAKLAVDAKLPAGMITAFGGSSAPSGWKICDGSAISRTDYADLFTAIGTTWGVGDGSTTFNLPDFRGRTVVGAGTGAGLTNRVLGAKDGEEEHLLTENESGLPSHQHNVPWRDNTSGSGSANATGTMTVSVTAYVASQSVTGRDAVSAHNNMQPYAVANFIIKT